MAITIAAQEIVSLIAGHVGSLTYARVMDRVRGLGQASMRLIDTVEKISSGGALAALRKALKPKL